MPSTRSLFSGLFAILLLLGGCSGSQKTRTISVPPSEAVTTLLQDALHTNVTLTRSDIRQRLGPPRRTVTDTLSNRHDPTQTDSVHTWHYPGLQVAFYDVTASAKEFIIRLTLNDTRYATPNGLQVGQSRDRVRGTLGPPTEHKTDQYIYELGEPAPTFFVITFKGDTISQLEWQFYFD